MAYEYQGLHWSWLLQLVAGRHLHASPCGWLSTSWGCTCMLVCCGACTTVNGCRLNSCPCYTLCGPLCSCCLLLSHGLPFASDGVEVQLYGDVEEVHPFGYMGAVQVPLDGHWVPDLVEAAGGRFACR